jgi:hypothetical protein
MWRHSTNGSLICLVISAPSTISHHTSGCQSRIKANTSSNTSSSVPHPSCIHTLHVVPSQSTNTGHLTDLGAPHLHWKAPSPTGSTCGLCWPHLFLLMALMFSNPCMSLSTSCYWLPHHQTSQPHGPISKTQT